jgi:hypothetical protein
MPVDVRDDAAGHVGILESDRVANGDRFLACSTETWPYEDIVAEIGRVLPELRFEPGPIVDPSPDRWKEREAEFRSIWGGLMLRNDRIRAALDMDFRPFDDSLRDCVESLVAVAGVTVSRAS